MGITSTDRWGICGDELDQFGGQRASVDYMAHGGSACLSLLLYTKVCRQIAMP